MEGVEAGALIMPRRCHQLHCFEPRPQPSPLQAPLPFPGGSKQLLDSPLLDPKWEAPRVAALHHQMKAGGRREGAEEGWAQILVVEGGG